MRNYFSIKQTGTIALMVVGLLLLLLPEAKAEGGEASITYVSSEAVYLDAGSDQGLHVGDSLAVVRDADTVAWIVITNISSHSAAAKQLSEMILLASGDKVVIPFVAYDLANRSSTEKVVEEQSISKSNKKRDENRVRGSVSLEHFLHQDQTGASRNWQQPALGVRLRIQNVRGTGAELSIRHKTRLYHRSQPAVAGQSTDEWKHRLTEISLRHDKQGLSNLWGFGRVAVPHVRGVGYIDGGYFARVINENWKIGIAAGSTPDYETSGFSTKRQKTSIYAAFESGDYRTKRYNASVALGSEYYSGENSRDILYLQFGYAQSGHLTISQSAEIDINRGWRYSADSKRFELSSYYGSIRYQALDNLSLNLSFDSRKQVRYFDNREIVDSLFDDRARQGVRLGLNYNLSEKVDLRTSGSVRFRSGVLDNTYTSSMSVRVRDFPLQRQSFVVRLYWIETTFMTSYRPIILYNLGQIYHWNMALNATGYFNKLVESSNSNYSIDLRASRYLSRNYFLQVQVREYLGSDLQSFELRTELSYSF